MKILFSDSYKAQVSFIWLFGKEIVSPDILGQQ